MKEAKHYFDKIPYDFKVPNAKEWICDQIEQAQKDAYNQALEDAIKNVITKEDYSAWSGQVWDDGPLPIIIDIDSILKLKK